MEITSLAVTMKILAALTKAGYDLSGGPTSNPTISLQKSLTDGTGDDKAEQVWFDERTLAAGADEDLDLAGGLTDPFGDTITFTKIKALLVLNTSDELSTPTDAEIQVGGGDTGDGTNAWDTWITSTAADGSEAVKVPVGGGHMLFNRLAAGFAVTAGVGDLLRIKNNDGSDQAQYQIMVVGEVT